MQATYETEFGRGLLEWDGDTLVRCELPDPARPKTTDPTPHWVRDLLSRLEAYWHGGMPVSAGSLWEDAGRTDFEREVYRIVSQIPAGTTRTYGSVAVEAGRPRAARAVGACMARNPFAPIIPCHRMVGSDGRLRGYAGGLDMKRRLLEMERS